MSLPFRAAILFLSALLLQSCNTSAPSGPVFSAWPGDIAFNFADPLGDTLPAPNGEEGDVIDLVQIEGQITNASVLVQMTFSGPITTFSGGQANGLSGFLDLDVDENAGTGVEAAVDVLGGDTGMGVDFFVNLADNALNQISLTQATTGATVAIPISVSGSTITFSFTRTLLGNEDGNMRISGVVSAGRRPATDIFPNQGHLSIRR